MARPSRRTAGLPAPQHRLRQVYPLLANRPVAGDYDDCGLGGVRPRPVIVRGPRHSAHEATGVDRNRLAGIEAVILPRSNRALDAA